VKYFDTPQGKCMGKFNLLGCSLISQSNGTSLTTFELKLSNGDSMVLRAESTIERDKWISFMTGTKEKVLAERKELMDEWKKEEPCVNCLAVLATEQAEKEEKEVINQTEVSKDATVQPADSSDLAELMGLFVMSVENKQMTFKDVFKNNDIIVLGMLRHFG